MESIMSNTVSYDKCDIIGTRCRFRIYLPDHIMERYVRNTK